MARRKFSEILQSGKINITKEYEKLYQLLYEKKFPIQHLENEEICDLLLDKFSLAEIINQSFKYFDTEFRKTSLDLDTFNKEFNLNFIEKKSIKKKEIDYFIKFCEYIQNIVYRLQICIKQVESTEILSDNKTTFINLNDYTRWSSAIEVITEQIKIVIEKIGYIPITNKEDITDFIPKSPEAIAVAESKIIPDNLTAYEVLKYYHHSLQGNIKEKKQILLKLAYILEPDINNKTLNIHEDLSCLFNNLDIRHNNVEEHKYKKPYIVKMPEQELEKWYDETYRVCLLAILELEHKKRQSKIDALRKQLKTP